LYNVGSGEDLPIRDLAGIVAGVVGYDGPVEWDTSKPDGTPRKLMDSSRIRSCGWAPRISLEDGIRSTYEWYLQARDAEMARLSA
jgi:GDP-L-fucose synthase